MIALCSYWLALSLGAAPSPPPPELEAPPPELEVPPPDAPDDPEEIVGPQPAEPADESDTDADDESEGSIEFAVPPPEDDEAETEAGEGIAPVDAIDESQWPDPGTAPNDGIGAIVSGAILIPVASAATYALLDGEQVSSDNNNIPIVVAGTGLGLIGGALIGLGVYRRVKLRRWEAAYRVQATWQGNGLMAAGALAINFGVVAALSGTLALTNDTPDSIGYGLLAAGLVTAGAIAPPMLLFGIRRKRRYRQTGGWVRPPLPPIPTTPAVSLVPGGLTIGVRGNF